MKLSIDKEGKIHIGLVLAGAVTAGAYTAGVLDYLLNSLQLWEDQYQKYQNGEIDEAVPKPNVVIDVLTGASAGSIAAAVTLLALITNKFKSVDEPSNEYSDDNLLFYTWVNFGLEQGATITDKLFSTDDLKSEKIKSILNTSFIDDLVSSLEEKMKTADIQQLPGYIHPNLEILMTLSNLRGIPIDLFFKNDSENVAHSMSYHKAFAYFEYESNGNSTDNPATLPLRFQENFDNLRLFLDCSRASGAFPIGLKSIPFHDIPKNYIEANLERIFGSEVIIKPRIEDTYEFMAVDGGMTNNEPIAEAMRILNQKSESKNKHQLEKAKQVQEIREATLKANIAKEELDQYFRDEVIDDILDTKPIILIDPFPNYLPRDSEGKVSMDYDLEKDSLFDIIPQLIKTLRNQVLFKEKDIIDLFEENTNKSMIWPTRYNESGEPLSNAIASAALGGFAGFFHRNFRVHDYMLGKKNCQNFLRYYFSRDAEKSNWPQEAIDQFSFKSNDDKLQIPLIPDYRITGRKEFRGEEKFAPILEESPSFPDFPQVSYEETIDQELEPKIKRRINAVIDSIQKQLSQSKKNDHLHPWIESRNDDKMQSGVIGKWLIDKISNLVKKKLIKKAKKDLNHQIVNTLITTLAEHDLFKNNPEPPDTRLNKNKKIDEKT